MLEALTQEEIIKMKGVRTRKMEKMCAFRLSVMSLTKTEIVSKSRKIIY
jgi:hypothetical protein